MDMCLDLNLIVKLKNKMLIGKNVYVIAVIIYKYLYMSLININKSEMFKCENLK